MRHRVHVDVYISGAGLLENLRQGRATRRVHDVRVGDRRVAHPLPIDIPACRVEARKEHDHRPIDAGRATVEMGLSDSNSAVHAQRVFTGRGPVVDHDLEASPTVRRNGGHLVVA